MNVGLTFLNKTQRELWPIFTPIQDDDDSNGIALIGYFVNSLPLAVWCGFNAFCSVLMFFLIMYMVKNERVRRSTYLDLVSAFTFVQFIYDTLFCIATFPNSTWTPWGARLQLQLWFFFGVLCSGFSLGIVFTVLYVVEKRAVPSNMHVVVICIANVMLGLIVCGITWNDSVGIGIRSTVAYATYGNIRDGMVLSTIALVTVLIWRIWLRINKKNNWRKNPLILLLKSAMVYPLVQVLSRSGTVYKTFITTRDIIPTDHEIEQTSIVSTITEPLAGVGGLLAFLIMQKYAFENFKRMLSPCAEKGRMPLPTIRETVSRHTRSRITRHTRHTRHTRQTMQNESIHDQQQPSEDFSLSDEHLYRSSVGSISSHSLFSTPRNLDYVYEEEEEKDDEYYDELEEYDEMELTQEYISSHRNSQDELPPDGHTTTNDNVSNPIQGDSDSRDIEMSSQTTGD